jgi:hypothetical protein
LLTDASPIGGYIRDKDVKADLGTRRGDCAGTMAWMGKLRRVSKQFDIASDKLCRWVRILRMLVAYRSYVEAEKSFPSSCFKGAVSKHGFLIMVRLGINGVRQ